MIQNYSLKCTLSMKYQNHSWVGRNHTQAETLIGFPRCYWRSLQKGFNAWEYILFYWLKESSGFLNYNGRRKWVEEKNCFWATWDHTFQTKSLGKQHCPAHRAGRSPFLAVPGHSRFVAPLWGLPLYPMLTSDRSFSMGHPDHTLSSAPHL